MFATSTSTVLVLAAIAASPAPSTTEVVVAGVQARIDATTDLQAKVEQELTVASLGRTIRAAGTVAFKKPGKMRWNLDGDEPQVIVADGETIWFFQPEDEQVLKARFETAFRSTTPISFLTGVGRIADDFEVAITKRGADRITLSLKPRRDAADLGRLQLDVDPRTYDIVAAEVVDPVGNVTRLSFSDLRRNSGVDDSLFRFEVPPGVDVVEAPIGY
jgi:outer membrane lipoprotein carrier protein